MERMRKKVVEGEREASKRESAEGETRKGGSERESEKRERERERESERERDRDREREEKARQHE